MIGKRGEMRHRREDSNFVNIRWYFINEKSFVKLGRGMIFGGD